MDKFNIKINKYLHISPLIIILLLSAYLGNYLHIFLTAYLAAILHEFAHIGTSMAFKIKIERMEILPFGITAKLKDKYIKEPYQEALIALAGPLSNLFLTMICYFLYKYFPCEELQYFILINISIAVINFIPCLPLDGGRILKAVLTSSWGFVKAFNFTIKLSKILIGLMLAFAIFLLLYCDFNFSLILIAAFLLSNITQEYRNISMVIMKELIHNKEKLKTNDINNARTVAVYEDVCARLLFKHFSYNYYYIIGIVNKDMKITKFITESQLIDAIFTKGVRIKMADI